MTGFTEQAWRVFRGAFRDGEQVIVEDDTGDFWWGTLLAKEEALVLTRPNGKSVEIEWDDVVLIAHDGFPIKELRGMSAQAAAVLAEKTNAEIIERLCNPPPKRRGMWLGGGCPFVAGPMVLSAIHNQGNRGSRYWYSDAAEVLEFVSKEGAILHNYDTDHLFILPEFAHSEF